MPEISKHFNDWIYPKVISASINAASKKIDEEFSNATGFCRYMEEDKYKQELSSIYEEKREWLKEQYFTQFDEAKLLDFHKLAAVLCRSILRLKPFAFNIELADKYMAEHGKRTDKEWVINNYLVNYKVAIDVSLGFTLYDLFGKIGEKKVDMPKPNEYGDLLKNLSTYGLEKYKEGTTPVQIEHEPFYNSQIIEIAINDTNGRDFDYLGFATNCFQLQQYSLLKYLYDKEHNK